MRTGAAGSRIGFRPLAILYVIAGAAMMFLVLWGDLGYPAFAKLLKVFFGHGVWVEVGVAGALFGVLVYFAVEVVRVYRKNRAETLKRRAERVATLLR